MNLSEIGEQKSMNKFGRSFTLAAALLLAASSLSACGSSAAGNGGSSVEAADAADTQGTPESTEAVTSAEASSEEKTGEHEPLTICAPSRSVKDFIDVVHKTYPEIVFDVDAYAGPNGTAYMTDQLLTGNQADIYSISYNLGNQYDLSDKLIDLSGYSFTDNYASSRLREVNEDGAIYLLPSYYSCIGITYNKKILEDNGWSLPTSLDELEELAPKVEAAGYRLALNEIGLPGYGFQYFCNILDTGYLSTLDGRKWQTDFLSGKTTLQDNPGMMKDVQLLQRWRDIGMLNGEMQGVDDGTVADEMAKGNTLFLLGTTNNIEERGGNEGDYGLMPYLSEDGSQNVYILNVSRYMGLSKKLEEPGNEQKLEDALHVMEVLSTQEGCEALNSSFVMTNLSPLKDAPVAGGNYYSDVLEDINAGYTAPFIYSGWDNAIVPYGNEMISFITGDATLDDVVQCIDENQHVITDKGESFTTVTDTISQDGCAKIVGIAFTEATGADLALVSVGGMDPENGGTNGEGVNGKLFAKPVTEQEISAFVPTGWNGTIHTLTLTGKRIRELAETGYDRKDRGYYFPYHLIKKDSVELSDDATYTVVFCGATEAVREEGNEQDTGILGIKAVEDYLSKFDTLTEADIDWN